MTAHTKDGGPANIASYYPEHCRTSCSDAEPINACAEGSTGCARCTALALDELERLRARVASLEESLHYANGTADLAMKHRDDAEKRVSELEQDAAMRGFLLDLRSDLREPAEREGGLFHYFYQRVSEQLGLSALAKDGA